MDAKAAVDIGPFSRGGKTAYQHHLQYDFKPSGRLTPYGILIPEWKDLFLYVTESKVTSDFIVDTLDSFWTKVKHKFPDCKTLKSNKITGRRIIPGELNL